MMYHGNWIVPRSFRIRIRVDMATVTAPFTPFSVDLDFAYFLTKQDLSGRFAKHSVVVTRIEEELRETPIAHAISEDFDWGEKGDVSWVIEEARHLEYYVYFDVEEKGPFHPASNRVALNALEASFNVFIPSTTVS